MEALPSMLVESIPLVKDVALNESLLPLQYITRTVLYCTYGWSKEGPCRSVAVHVKFFRVIYTTWFNVV